ncbi:MAG: ion transporter [Gammaproteobacteria bacterium]|nr:ion transporter [Gammaproteobacteria bacterium]
MKLFAQRVVNHAFFDYSIIALILINAAVLGLETSRDMMALYEYELLLSSDIILALFIAEALLKMIAVMPRLGLYFKDGWNLFDFSVIVLSLLPATGELAMVARLARLLRVMRLISTIPELRLIVSTLIRSLPGMSHVIMLMGVIFYMYAIAGYHLFAEHDPQHWGTLGISLLTLFRVVTLEDWTDLMYTAMEMSGYSWMFFVSFVVMGTFVIINLFIAVVLNNLDEAKQEQLRELQGPVGKDEILEELKTTQQALQRLQEKMERMSG